MLQGPQGELISYGIPIRLTLRTSAWVSSLSVVFEDPENNKDCIISVVHGPNVNQRRTDFWSEFDTVRARWNGPWCNGGDFDIIRSPEAKTRWRLPETTAFTDLINSQSVRFAAKQGFFHVV